MKVLHILNELKFSGAEIMYVAAANEFQELGCKLYVVNTTPVLGEYTPFFREAGYTILHWPYCRKNILQKIKYCQKVIAYIKSEEIDVIHIHRSDLQWQMSLCAWIAGCKAVYTFHNVFPSHWYSYFYHILQRWSAKAIFNCTFQTISDSVYLHEKTFFHNKTIKVYNWYNSNCFYPGNVNEKLSIRRELNIPNDALVIISVGGCSPIKRHTDIIKALPILVKDYPKTIYLHLGEGNTLMEELELAESLKVKKYIRFERNQTDVRKYLVASDMYVMPSKFEGISLTTIEALACNVPAVLYDVPGLKDFNSKAECAVLIREDFHMLATTIISLLKNKEKQEVIIRNGKTFVDEYFLMKTNVKKIFNLYFKK